MPLSGEDNGRSPWNAFTTDNGPWAGDRAERGRRWTDPVVSGSRSGCWYPSAGFRASSSAIISNVTVEGNARNSGTSGYLRFVGNAISTGYTAALAYGLSVRCVRE